MVDAVRHCVDRTDLRPSAVGAKKLGRCWRNQHLDRQRLDGHLLAGLEMVLSRWHPRVFDGINADGRFLNPFR